MPSSDKPISVLLVDDEDVFLELGSMQLIAAGFAVTTARGANEGMARVRDLIPNVIVSDIFMPPGPNGWEFALSLRENQRTREIPLFILSSLRDPWSEFDGDVEDLRSRIGDVHVLSKVEDLDFLAERISALLKKT